MERTGHWEVPEPPRTRHSFGSYAEFIGWLAPNAHGVADPSRALRVFTDERLGSALRSLGCGCAVAACLVAAGVFLVIAGSTLKSALIGLFLGGLGVWAGLRYGAQTLATVRYPSAAGRDTPRDAARLFLDAVSVRMWHTAYNALTDNAQKLGSVDLPREGPAQLRVPDITIDSVDTFKDCWSDLSISWKPLWAQARVWLGDDGQTWCVTVPIDVGAAAPPYRGHETYDIALWMVQRGGHWFVCNGFLWPVHFVERYVRNCTLVDGAASGPPEGVIG